MRTTAMRLKGGLVAAALTVLLAGCSPFAGSGGVTGAAVVAKRGTIVITRADADGGEATTSRLTPDGLVLTGSPAQVRTNEGILGEANPAEVGEVVGIAVRDGFFSWEATQPIGASPERRERASGVVLAVGLEPTAAGGPALSNTITVVSIHEVSPLARELIAQVEGLVSQAAARPLGAEAAKAILAAKALLAAERSKMPAEALDKGPCLTQELMPGWSVDIAHDPRTPADDDPRNMCRAFAAGKTRHLVELAPNGDFIQIR